MLKKSIVFVLAVCLYGQNLFSSALFKRVPAIVTTNVRSFRSALGTPKVASQLRHIGKPATQLHTPELTPPPKNQTATYRKNPSSLSETAIQPSSIQRISYESPKSSFPKENKEVSSFKPITMGDLKDADIVVLKSKHKQELSSVAQNSYSQVKTVQADYEKAMEENARLEAQLAKTKAKHQGGIRATKEAIKAGKEIQQEADKTIATLALEKAALEKTNARLIRSSKDRTQETVKALQTKNQQLAKQFKEQQSLQDQIANQQAQHAKEMEALRTISKYETPQLSDKEFAKHIAAQ